MSEIDAARAPPSGVRARFPDGRMGSEPVLATPEKGGALVKLAAEGLAEAARAFGAEAAV